MVPSSVAKRKKLRPDRVPCLATKPVVVLATWPVGAETAETPAGGGIVTIKGEAAGCGTPSPLKRVEKQVRKLLSGGGEDDRRARDDAVVGRQTASGARRRRRPAKEARVAVSPEPSGERQWVSREMTPR